PSPVRSRTSLIARILLPASSAARTSGLAMNANASVDTGPGASAGRGPARGPARCWSSIMSPPPRRYANVAHQNSRASASPMSQYGMNIAEGYALSAHLSPAMTELPVEHRERDAAAAAGDEPELGGGAGAEVDPPPAAERPAVVDPHHHRLARRIGHP